MTLGDAVSEFLDSQTGLIAPTTRRNYIYGLSKLTEHFGNDVEVERISRRDIRAWRLALAANGHANATINLTMAVAKRLLNWLADELPETPARLIAELRPFRVGDDCAQVRAIPVDAITKMLEQARADNDLRATAMILYLYSTGGRVSGMIGLRMGDLDLARGRALVTEKGGKTRVVFLAAETITALRDYIEYQRPRNAADADFVFLTKRRGPVGRGAVWAMLKTLARRAGIADDVPTNPHAWRHAFAIGYLQNGGDLSSLSTILGHASVAITHEYYVAWSVDALHEQHRRHNPLSSIANER